LCKSKDEIRNGKEKTEEDGKIRNRIESTRRRLRKRRGKE
jgi:hypothetical protein